MVGDNTQYTTVRPASVNMGRALKEDETTSCHCVDGNERSKKWNKVRVHIAFKRDGYPTKRSALTNLWVYFREDFEWS